MDRKIPDITIAVDGFSSTGKSTFAKALAARLSFVYLDSGAMYRGVTLHAQEQGLIDSEGGIDESGLRKALETLDVHFESTVLGSRTYIGSRCVEDEIRGMKVSSQVSPVSAVPFVREYVDERLHEFGAKGRIVMDGRDIGTTVFPDAQIKIFMTASDEVRAARRFDELVSKGVETDIEQVRRNLRERDYMDSHRETSPLQRAADAFCLDNSDMSLSEEIAWAMGLIQGRVGIL